MKIAMMGAGGVGGYYGARLAEAGHDVVFIARGAHAEAMRRDGLRIESPHGAAHIQPAHVVTDPREAGVVDLVIIAVKLWDTETAARAILPLVGDATTVLSLQNSIDKEEVIGAVVGARHLLGALTYIAVVISAPGVITQTGTNQRIVLGELGPLDPLDDAAARRLTVIAAALRSAHLDVEETPDIRRAIWEKFVFLSAHSAVTAATRLPVGKLRHLAATRDLMLDAMREGAALARAEGIDLGEPFLARQMAFLDALPPEARASMAQDLARGNRLELDWLSGAILRRAAAHALATPVHRTLYAVLAPYAQGAP
jgi:2-dehydropantoate 2-reductase